MKRPLILALVASLPLLLIATVWQTSRFTALAAETQALEASQEEWVDQNKNILGSIAVVSRREQIEAWARKLGLEKASPERRVHILPPASVKGAAGTAGAAKGGQNG